jgi:competence protein ComEC
LEVVILTHPHSDHIDSLLYIFERYSIGEIWLYPVCYESQIYQAILNSNNTIRYIQKGYEYKYKDIHIKVIWPEVSKAMECTTGIYQSRYGNINNDSLVIHLLFNGKEYLLMGDAEVEVERELLNEGVLDDMHIFVLKAGHHCSNTSNSETFLKRVKPIYAICSCGEGNKFGHPSYETLQTFDSLSVQYYVTYLSNTVVFR